MTVTLQHNDIRIELADDSAFNQTADSPTSYSKVIQTEKDKQYTPTSQQAIKIFKGNNPINSAIILATGGATSVDNNAALIDDNNLIIRCCNKLFSLGLPDLQTNWVTEPDWATCFSIYKYKDTYISHGETSIARIDKSGNILWSYGGADIFVCLEKGIPFKMFDNYIALTDFNGSTYEIGYDGKTISYKESNYYQQEIVTVVMKTPNRINISFLITYLGLLLLGILLCFTGYSFSFFPLDILLLIIIVSYPVVKFFRAAVISGIKILIGLIVTTAFVLIFWNLSVLLAFGKESTLSHIQQWDIGHHKIVLTKKQGWAGPPYLQYEITRYRFSRLINKTVAVGYPAQSEDNSCKIKLTEDTYSNKPLFEFDTCTATLKKIPSNSK